MFAFLTVFLYHWKANEEDPFEAFARSILTFAVLVLGITNFLSLFKWCTRVGIFVGWTLAIFIFGTVYVTRFGMTLPDLKKFFANIKKSIRNRTWIEYIMLGLCLILCVILFVGALFTVPANYDSMTYHLGRIGHWIDQRSVNHFVTDIDRQLYSPVLAEYYLLHMMLLSGSDTFVNFLQYVSMLFCAAFIYRNARLLGTSRTFSMFGAFLFLTMPLTISQSVTTQNDLFAASIFALFLYYFLWFIRRPQLIFDRIELENQAKKNFINYLKPDYDTVIFKEHTEDWRRADIVVSTVQTLAYNNKYRSVFKPTDFSLIIADESHRSISGNSRAVFEYFIGYKLGLTATPKDYLKNVDAEDLAANDPRAWERRQLLDTYRTFGCESGEPTFRYSLIDGVNDPDGPFLVNPTVVDARTEITTQLLADEGYAVINHGDEEDEDEEETYFARDFEKKFFSEETKNSTLISCFFRILMPYS